MTTLIEEMAREMGGMPDYFVAEGVQTYGDLARAALSVILKRLREPSGELLDAIAAQKGKQSYMDILHIAADHLEQDADKTIQD